MSPWSNEHASRIRTAARPLIAGLVAFGLAACGSDDGGTTTGPDDISEQQAAEVATAVSTAVGHAFGAALGAGGSASVAPGAALAPTSLNELPVAAETTSWDFSNTASCPQGGSLSADGSGTITTTQSSGSTSIQWDWSSDVSYSDCGVGTDEGAYTLSTSSPLQFDGTGQVTSDGEGSGSGSFDWTYSGSFSWSEAGGPSGSCDMNLTTSLTFQSSGSTGTWTGSVSGSICGHSIDESWDTTINVGA